MVRVRVRDWIIAWVRVGTRMIVRDRVKVRISVSVRVRVKVRVVFLYFLLSCFRS